MLPEEVILQDMSSNVCKVEVICSYGFDGSSGQSIYKQIFSSSFTTDFESTLFATTLYH